MKIPSNIRCSKAQKLMSPYIDSMAEPEESEALELHLETCKPCRRQLQSFVSMRNLLAGVEPVRPPEDLVLDTRIQLSHARSGSWYDRFELMLINVLKPVAIPAMSGIALTILSFSVLFGQLSSNFNLKSLDRGFVLEEPVRTTGLTLPAYAGANRSDLAEPLSVQANVGADGFVYGIKIIGGAKSPADTRWVNDLLYTAQYKPATRSGKPVISPIPVILSFVNVRS